MITVFQHGIGEPPGCIPDILEKKGLPYEIIRPYAGDAVPKRTDSSHYIFLGGLMSVNDEEHYPWLVREKMLIRAAISSDIPVFGICLGAQLIASSFSREVRRCKEEKGWTIIRKCDRSDIKMVKDGIAVFEWHGECLDLPEGSSLIYKGDTITNQMFSFGSSIGVQFHPEVTESIIRGWIADEPPHLQDKILSELSLYIGQSQELCGEILDRFIQRGVT